LFAYDLGGLNETYLCALLGADAVNGESWQPVTKLLMVKLMIRYIVADTRMVMTEEIVGAEFSFTGTDTLATSKLLLLGCLFNVVDLVSV
jgi:hypothetical protein